MSRRGELLYGVRPVLEALEGDPAGVLEIWLADSRAGEAGRRIESRARSAGCALQRVPRRTLERLVGKVSHQGVVIRYRPVERSFLDFDGLLAGVHDASLLLVLDEVQDPRNLGACLRSAAAAGADALLVPRRRSAPLGAAARKAASGAGETTPVVRVGNLADALLRLRAAGLRVLGAVPEGPDSIFEVDLQGPLAFVLGAEGGGLRRLTASRCDALVRIPMRGRVGSLNVSVAAGVCLFEALRRRHFASPPPIP